MQMDMIARITEYCVRKDIISSNDAEWFSYGLVQRSEKLITICFLFPLGWLLSSFSTSLAFYLSFFLLRTRANGYHAKTSAGCLLFSVCSECVLFLLILPYLKSATSLWILALSTITIFWLDEGRTGSVQTYGKVNGADIRYGTDFEPEYKVLCVCQRNCTRTRLYGLFTDSGTRKTEI